MLRVTGRLSRIHGRRSFSSRLPEYAQGGLLEKVETFFHGRHMRNFMPKSVQYRKALGASVMFVGGICYLIDKDDAARQKAFISGTLESMCTEKQDEKNKKMKSDENKNEPFEIQQKNALSVGARVVSLAMLFFPVFFFYPWYSAEDWYALIRQKIEQAGPVFIKWGQWASTRYDLFPIPLCDELNMLTQDAPAHSIEDTRKTLEDSYGPGIHNVLHLVSDEPVKSASIAQVYRAYIHDAHGQPVELAVKVQHPNLDNVMSRDFAILEQVANFADWCLPRFTGYKGLKVANVLGQFRLKMEEQLDFKLEKSNLEQFINNFWTWSFVSFPIPQHATEDVLVESFEKGTSIYDYIKRNQLEEVENQDEHTTTTFSSGSSSSSPSSTTSSSSYYNIKHATPVRCEESSRGTKNYDIFSSPPTHSSSSSSSSSSYFLSKKRKTAEEKKKELQEKNLLPQDAVRNLGSLGVATLLKMIIMDNFIHADLHPGNLLVREAKPTINPLLYGWRWIRNHFFGFSTPPHKMAHICILDAGLSAQLPPQKFEHVRRFFEAINDYDGEKLGHSILNLSDNMTDPANHQGFIEELEQKSQAEDHLTTTEKAQVAENFLQDIKGKIEVWKEQRYDMEKYGDSRCGDSMKDALDSVRLHGVSLHPTVTVMIMSAITLEGWQFELDPSISIMDSVDVMLKRSDQIKHFQNFGHKITRLIDDPVSLKQVHSLTC